MIEIVPSRNQDRDPNVVVDEDAYQAIVAAFIREWDQFWKRKNLNIEEEGLRLLSGKYRMGIIVAVLTLRWKRAKIEIAQLEEVQNFIRLTDADSRAYIRLKGRVALESTRKFSRLYWEYERTRRVCHLHEDRIYVYSVVDWLAGIINVYRLDTEDIVAGLNNLYSALSLQNRIEGRHPNSPLWQRP